MQPVHNPVNPGVMAASAGLGAFIDQLGIRREVIYLVNNGIDPHEAVQRVVDYRRRGVIWAMVAVPSVFWSGIFVGWGLSVGVPGLLLGDTLLNLIPALFLGVLGTVMAYLIVMTQIWNWRRCAAGCAWEDSRPKWRPGIRPAELVPDVPPQRNDAFRRLAAYLVVGFILCVWLLPVVTGLVQALIALGGGQP